SAPLRAVVGALAQVEEGGQAGPRHLPGAALPLLRERGVRAAPRPEPHPGEGGPVPGASAGRLRESLRPPEGPPHRLGPHPDPEGRAAAGRDPGWESLLLRALLLR